MVSGPRVRRCGPRESRVLTAGLVGYLEDGLEVPLASTLSKEVAWSTSILEGALGDNGKDGPGVRLTGVVGSVHRTHQLNPR